MRAIELVLDFLKEAGMINDDRVERALGKILKVPLGTEVSALGSKVVKAERPPQRDCLRFTAIWRTNARNAR